MQGKLRLTALPDGSTKHKPYTGPPNMCYTAFPEAMSYKH